jgi:glutamate synthase domain-containing protein 1
MCGVGFVARVDGTPTHEVLAQGIAVLAAMEHRGAVGSDPL